MVAMYKHIRWAALVGGFVLNSVVAVPPTTFSRPYDADYGIKTDEERPFVVGVNVEHGITRKSYNEHDHRVGLLSLYSPSESSLAFLLNAESGSQASNLWRNINRGSDAATDPADDQFRGRFLVQGKYTESDITFFARCKLPLSIVRGEWDLSVYLPVIRAELSDVEWNDQTASLLPVDQRVKALLTSQIDSVGRDLGNLDLRSWRQLGCGDLVAMLGWSDRFKQHRELLKATTLHARCGLMIPTGARRNPDRVLSIPLGNDGAWGLPLELGLDLNFVYNIVVGGQVDFLGLFNVTQDYRLKTDVSQTDFLIRDKALVKKVNGAVWRFMLHAGAEKILYGLSADVQYQFSKHDEDRLYPLDDTFNSGTVNSIGSIQNWTTHTITTRLGYDFATEKSKIGPRLSLFYKLPLAGRRAVAPHTFGGQLSIAF